jgi:hypothetical protein
VRLTGGTVYVCRQEYTTITRLREKISERGDVYEIVCDVGLSFSRAAACPAALACKGIGRTGRISRTTTGARGGRVNFSV